MNEYIKIEPSEAKLGECYYLNKRGHHILIESYDLWEYIFENQDQFYRKKPEQEAFEWVDKMYQCLSAETVNEILTEKYGSPDQLIQKGRDECRIVIDEVDEEEIDNWYFEQDKFTLPKELRRFCENVINLENQRPPEQPKSQSFEEWLQENENLISGRYYESDLEAAWNASREALFSELDLSHEQWNLLWHSRNNIRGMPVQAVYRLVAWVFKARKDNNEQ